MPLEVTWMQLRELVMGGEAWRAAVHGVAKSRTRLSDWTELNWMQLQIIILSEVSEKGKARMASLICGI